MNEKEKFYLDYNATAPICEEFLLALAKGEVPFANPSSIHSSGKAAARYLDSCKGDLYQHFGLSALDYEIIFHSGATEASQLFLNLASDESLIYFNSDHASITNLAKNLEQKNRSTFGFDISRSGEFDLDKLIEKIQSLQKQNKKVWLNFTPLNNETGIVWDLALAREVKEKTGCSIYVDAVQTVGKMKDYHHLDDHLDVYTFSGHKFGALKGVGFSFYRKYLSVAPLFFGGGQQKGLRPGTINITGIASLIYALKAVDKKQMQDVFRLKKQIEVLLSERSDIEMIANKSFNTISFIHKKQKSDMLLIHFDLAGLEVSSGSACSSGSVEPSVALKAMGFGEFAAAGIRISLGKSNLFHADEIIKRLKNVLEKL